MLLAVPLWGAWLQPTSAGFCWGLQAPAHSNRCCLEGERRTVTLASGGARPSKALGITRKPCCGTESPTNPCPPPTNDPIREGWQAWGLASLPSGAVTERRRTPRPSGIVPGSPLSAPHLGLASGPGSLSSTDYFDLASKRPLRWRQPSPPRSPSRRLQRTARKPTAGGNRAAALRARGGAAGHGHVRRWGRNPRSRPSEEAPRAGAEPSRPVGLCEGRRACPARERASPSAPHPRGRWRRTAAARGWSCSKPRTTTSCRAGSGRCGAAGGTAACSWEPVGAAQGSARGKERAGEETAAGWLAGWLAACRRSGAVREDGSGGGGGRWGERWEWRRGPGWWQRGEPRGADEPISFARLTRCRGTSGHPRSITRSNDHLSCVGVSLM